MNREEIIEQHLVNAWDLRRVRDYEASKRNLSSASKLCYESDYSYLGRINHIYMQHEADFNRFHEALEYCRIAMSFYVKAEIPGKIAHATRHLADLLLALDQLEEAEQNYLVAIDIYRKENDTHAGDLANALRGLSQVLEKRMEYTKAAEVWEEILQLYTDAGFADGIEEANEKINYLRKKS